MSPHHSWSAGITGVDNTTLGTEPGVLCRLYQPPPDWDTPWPLQFLCTDTGSLGSLGSSGHRGIPYPRPVLAQPSFWANRGPRCKVPLPVKPPCGHLYPFRKAGQEAPGCQLFDLGFHGHIGKLSGGRVFLGAPRRVVLGAGG